MSFETVLAFLFMVTLLYALARLAAGPLKAFLSLVFRFCLGVFLIIAANSLGRSFGFTVALNPYNALVAGFLNLPGLFLLFFLRHWLLF